MSLVNWLGSQSGGRVKAGVTTVAAPNPAGVNLGGGGRDACSLVAPGWPRVQRYPLTGVSTPEAPTREAEVQAT